MTPAEKKAWLAGAAPAAPAPAQPPEVKEAPKPPAPVVPTASTPKAVKPPKPKAPAAPAPVAPDLSKITPEQIADIGEQLSAEPALAPDPEAKYEPAKSATHNTIIEETPGALKRLGSLVLPSVASALKYAPGLPAKLLAPEVQKAAEDWAGTAREEIKQEDTAKAAEAEKNAEEARKALVVPEPALVLARSLDGITDAKDPNKQFLDARTQQILNFKLLREGGADNVTDGPTYNKLVRDARREAVEELTKLYIRRQWTHSVGPEDLSHTPEPTWLDALVPKREFTIGEDGGVQEIHTESVPGWFFNVPLSILDYGATAAMQAVDEDEDRSFAQRYLENVKDRKDLVTFRIEADPELQKDLASGDTSRVNGALLTLVPWLGLTIMTPSPVEATTFGASAVRAARNAPAVLADLKAASTAAEKAAVLTSFAQRAQEAEQAAKASLREAQTAEKVHALAQEYRVDSNLERAAKSADLDVAEMARNDLAAAMQSDPDVAEYLRTMTRGDVPDPRDAPKVPFGPAEQARQVEVEERLKELSAQRKAAPDLDSIKPIDAELETLRKERDNLTTLENAKRGEERFAQVYKDTADKVVADLEEMASGGSRPDRPASFYAPRQEPVAPTVDTALLASVGVSQAALLDKLSKVNSSEELLRILSRADALDREAIAKKIGYASYGELKTKASTVQTASIDKAQAAADAAKAELAKFQDAVDNGDTSPETDALFEQANAAQDALDASKINAKTRAKRQAQVDKMFEAARASESADFDRAEKALLAAQKKYASADKALQGRLSAVKAAAPRNAEVMQRLESVRGDFDKAAKQLSASAEYERAARKAARSEPPTDPVVLLAGDRRTLMDDLSVYNRNRRRATQDRVKTIVNNVYDFFRDHVWHPWREVEEASLTDASRRVRRVLDGETAEVGERLTRAFASGSEDAPNPAAIAAVSDEMESFRAAVKERSLPSEFFTLVAGAYIRSDVTLEPGRAKALAQVVADWASSGAPVEALRDAVYTATVDAVGDNTSLLVPPGLGDTFFAMGVGYGGATRKAMLTEGSIFVDAETARDINAIFDQPHVGTGGNPRASRGVRALAGGVVDPFAYVPTKPGRQSGRVFDASIPMEAQQPYVPAFGRSSIPKGSPTEDVDALAELMAVADEMFTRELYVPRSVRDNFLKYAEAAIATRRLGGRMTALEGAAGFWKQAAILGVGLSNPGQGWLDHMGDLWQASTRSPWLAAKTALRSTPSQLLHTKGMAQVTRLTDWALKRPAGATAKMLDETLSKLTMSPNIDRILDATKDVVGNTNMTGEELLKLFRREGVLENFYSSQVTRTVAAFGTVALPKWARTTVGAVQGVGAGAILGGPLGAIVGALGGAIFGRSGAAGRLMEANRDSLMFLANAAANRRRAAIVYGLIEEGMAPEKACREGVRIFGDFAGEMSPWLRTSIGTVFPFLSYRKFNTRRALKALANPFWMKGLANAMEHGGDLASDYANAFFSSEDEYGFHTGDMAIEPDPIELEKLLARVHSEHPDWPLDRVWREAEPQMAALPRAIDRYNALKARLDAMPYLDAKRAILAGFKTVEDGTEEVNGEPKDGGLTAMMGAYWAPDPMKHMLPPWAQDRAAMFLGKHRAQTTMSYYLAGAGRKGRVGDETRYMLAPPDPNIDGVAFPLLAMAMAADPGGTAGPDALGILARDPTFNGLMSVIGYVPQEGTMDTPIPSDVGINLLPLLDKRILITTDRDDKPIDPGDPNFDPMTTHYYINGRFNSALHVMPFLTAAWLAALEVSQAKINAQGGEGFRGVVDPVDNFGAYSWFVTGNMTKVRNISPSSTAKAEKNDTIELVRKLIGEMGGTDVPVPQTSLSTMNRREWSSVAAKDPNWLNTAKATADRVRAENGRYGMDDITYLRLYLVSQGGDPKVVGALTTRDVVRQILKSE